MIEHIFYFVKKQSATLFVCLYENASAKRQPAAFTWRNKKGHQPKIDAHIAYIAEKSG